MEKTTLPPGVGFVLQGQLSMYRPHFKLNVGNLAKAKRGDWIGLLIRFPLNTFPSGEQIYSTEFLSAEITAVVNDTGLVKCKILSNPVETSKHSLTYGDELTLAQAYILTYEESTAQQVQQTEHLLTGVKPEAKPINSEDQKLRDKAKSMPTVIPEPKKKYWLRNGTLVTVWTNYGGEWIGVADDGTEMHWKQSGAHATDRDLDIVKDLAEALA
jgi:hypothetical protein